VRQHAVHIGFDSASAVMLFLLFTEFQLLTIVIN
jgi:hypothetical protein